MQDRFYSHQLMKLFCENTQPRCQGFSLPRRRRAFKLTLVLPDHETFKHPEKLGAIIKHIIMLTTDARILGKVYTTI